MPISSTAGSGGIKQIVRGTMDLGSSVNATIASVNMAKSFIVTSNGGAVISFNYYYANPPRVRLTSATNVEFTLGAQGSIAVNSYCAYEVVEWA